MRCARCMSESVTEQSKKEFRCLDCGLEGDRSKFHGEKSLREALETQTITQLEAYKRILCMYNMPQCIDTNPQMTNTHLKVVSEILNARRQKNDLEKFKMLEPIGKHHYGDDGNVYEVSQAAKNEKDANWVEFEGYADGYARVEHEDWQTLWDTLVESTGKDYGVMQAFLCFAKTPTGEIAHIGSITNLGNGKFELGG